MPYLAPLPTDQATPPDAAAPPVDTTTIPAEPAPVLAPIPVDTAPAPVEAAPAPDQTASPPAADQSAPPPLQLAASPDGGGGAPPAATDTSGTAPPIAAPPPDSGYAAPPPSGPASPPNGGAAPSFKLAATPDGGPPPAAAPPAGTPPLAPAAPGTTAPLGPEKSSQDIATAQQGLAQSASNVHSPGDLLQVAGAAKDVAGAYMGMNKSDFTPARANFIRWESDRLYDEATTGDPFARDPNPQGMDRAQWDAYRDHDPFAAWAKANPDQFKQTYEQGFTTPEKVVWAPGPDAPWEAFQNPHGPLERLGEDIIHDPYTNIAGIAADVATLGGASLATRGGELAARGLEGGQALRVAGKVAELGGEAANTVMTGGLNKLVPAGFSVAGKVLKATPLGQITERAAAEGAANATQEAGTAVLSLARAAEGQPGVPGIGQIGAITQPTADAAIRRITLPGDAAHAPIDLTYHLDGEGKLNGVYDAAVPGPNDRWRPATQADAQTIYDAFGRLPEADRTAFRSQAYPELTRVTTAPNEPFIEPAAERYISPITGQAVDTGRIGTGAQRELDDLRGAMLRDGKPDQVLTNFTDSWMKSLYSGSEHPLTRRPLAEGRLEMMRQVIDSLPPEYRTREVTAHLQQMQDLLPKQATVDGIKWVTGSLQGHVPGTPAGGHFAPLSAREVGTLRNLTEIANPADFTKQLPKFRMGPRAGAKQGVGILYDRKPPPGAFSEFDAGYRTYQDVMTHRLTNPPTWRGETNALKNELVDLQTSPSRAAAGRENAIREALANNGIIPNANAPTDQVLTDIENHLRTTRTEFPPLPGANKTPAYGVYTPGSQDERWGMRLPDSLSKQLDTPIEINGGIRTEGERLFDHWQGLGTAQALAARQAGGITLSPRDEKALSATLSKVATRFPGEYKGLTAEKLATMPSGELDRLASSLTKADVQIAKGVRAPTGRMLRPSETSGLWGKVLAPYDKFINLWRSTVLYNPARGIQYPMLQVAGNSLTSLIASESNPRLLGRYLFSPVSEWPRTFKFLRDAESEALPLATRMREEVGLGRTANLGRVARDQLGSRTAFNQADSHAITKAVGKVAANQTLKDLADTGDLKLRQAAYASIFGPAYSRLKKDLAPMTEKRFADYAASAGAPVALGRDVIDTAIHDLEGLHPGGRFSPPELRKALYEAAGGASAPNRKVVYDAADQMARDYHGELLKLDAAAQHEVSRIAFDGGDTNLESALSRTLMFTWWVSRASRLYATEAAGSPIQMALWSRAIGSSQRRQAEGTDPRYAQYVNFMKTPAGYLAQFNPYNVIGTWLLGTTADPTDERQVVTKIGEFFSGGWGGDNLVISPLLAAAGQALGVFGQDYRTPDWLGTGRPEKEIIDALNLANEHLGFYTTESGKPNLIPYQGVSQGTLNAIAQRISGLLPGTQKVAGYDPTTSQDGQIAALISEQVMAANPDLDPNNPHDADTIRNGVEQALSNHDSPMYQQALSRYVDSLYIGPGATGEGGWRDVLAGAASHFALPMSISRQPDFRTERNLRMGRDTMRSDGTGPWLSPTPEASAFDKIEGRIGSETPGARDLNLIGDAAAGDPHTQKVRDFYYSLQYDDPTKLAASFKDLGITNFTIDTKPFTAEQIASLPSDDRKTLANAWLDGAGERGTMTDYYANRDAQLKTDSRYANAEALPKYAQQYGAGVDAFVDDTAAMNPNYQRFINGSVVIGGQRVSLPDLRVSNHDEWVKQVTQYDQAKEVIAGVKDSRYGLEVDPKYAGMVAGLPAGESVGSWYRTDLAEQAKPENKDTPFTSDLRDNYAKYTTLGKSLDALDAQWGQPTGTNRAIFVQNVMNGALDSSTDKAYALPYGTHQALVAMGVSDYFPDTKALKQYFAWQLQQPSGTDTTIDAYNTAYWAGKNKDAVPQIALRLATGQVPPPNAEGVAPPYDAMGNLVMTDAGVAPGVRAGQSSTARPVALGTQPGQRDGTQIPAGMPVTTGQMMTGSDGSTWVYLTVPNSNVGGWANVSDLTPAA